VEVVDGEVVDGGGLVVGVGAGDLGEVAVGGFEPLAVVEVGGVDPFAVGGFRVAVGVLAEVGERWPLLARRIRDEQGAVRRYVNVYVDGEDARVTAGLETPVEPGSEIQVLPSVAGGAE